MDDTPHTAVNAQTASATAPTKGGSSRQRVRRFKPKTGSYKPHWRMFRAWCELPAWQALEPAARVVYAELELRFNGVSNNGRIGAERANRARHSRRAESGCVGAQYHAWRGVGLPGHRGDGRSLNVRCGRNQHRIAGRELDSCAVA